MAEKQYLICDCVGSANLEILSESSVTGDKGVYIRGKFQEYDVQNKNKRVYPKSVLEPQVDGLLEVISNHGLLGELDHPTDSIIHFENASHMITKLWWEGTCLMGEARVLNTPSGKILETLIKEGVQIGISSRGVGSGHMNREGVTVINDGFKLITFDVVADPSTPGAYLKQESTENEPEKLPVSETKETKDDDTEESLRETSDSSVDSVLKAEAVNGFLKALFEAQLRNK